MAEDDFDAEEGSSSGILILLAGIAFLLALGALAWIYSLQNRLEAAETKLNQAQEQRAELAANQAEIRRQLRATTEAFGAKVGITQRQIELRSEEILRQQEADTRKQVSNVSKAVSNVRTDVGGVKQDVASTRQELATTEQQLHAAIGDMGVQSGLIAKNAQQLDYLKHLGDRNYSEFTLRKGQPALAISTIKLQLRKADVKRSRYTLEIFADDKRVEKKNRDLDEPLQFYAGKPPMLLEIVVNQIDKNQVSGYLSAPKSVPQPNAP
jgi:hypothetical protein